MKSVEGNVKIFNMPEGHSKYVVCKLVNRGLWYYTSWSNVEDAENVAGGFENGVVVEVE